MIIEKMLNDLLAAPDVKEICVDAETREVITTDILEYPCDYDYITVKPYCTQNNNDCGNCSLVNYGMDCRNNAI